MKKFEDKLKELDGLNRRRSLNLPQGLDLTSNDYLGMRTHPVLRQEALRAIESGLDLGAGGSRLLRGHTEVHHDLEEFAAGFFDFDRSLFFPSGFQANFAIFSTLADRHDLIVFDEHVHASVRDGVHSSNARSVKARHNDLNDFEDILKRHRDDAAQIWVAVESLYSMDGDLAPLPELYALAEKYDAYLIVDEAHATGVWGQDGKGLAFGLPRERLVVLHTCGKAIGIAGGLMCASEAIVDFMVNAARPFLFSTAPIPLQALLVQRSLEILASHDGQMRREKLFKRIERAQEKLGGHGTQIVPIILGADKAAIEASAALQERGYDVRAIRPPTVPEGTSRLRVSLSSELNEVIMEDFFSHILSLIKEPMPA